MRTWLEILFVGYVPSKKNNLRKGRKGQGYHYDEATRACIDALTTQVPAAYRGLKLVHPKVSWQITVPAARQDRDAIKTTILDILVKTGVLANDNIKNYNGHEHNHPAIVDPTQEPSVLVRLRPAPDARRAAA